MKRTALQCDFSVSFLSRIVMFLALFLFCASVSAQKISPSPRDLYAEANEYMIAGDYPEALALLINLESKGFRGANVCYRIGICYLNGQGQKKRSIPYLKSAVEHMAVATSDTLLNEETAPLKSLLYLGIAYRTIYDLDKAVGCFTEYANSLPEMDTAGRALAQFHIDRCLNARELMAAPARFTTDTLSETINTTHSDYNPVLTPDERQLFYMQQLKFYDAVMSGIKNDSSWKNPENLTPRIHSDGDHLVTGTSEDGNLLLLVLNDVYANGEIFSVTRRNGEWGEPEKLNANINTRFNETHASLSPDGNVLYFTSDRQGGMGGLDIYRSKKGVRGDWGPAENLGPLVNTALNEESPFLSPDGKTLFFSSQGHYNMGGYDIFMSAVSPDGQWQAPVNAGFPINTTDNDCFFFPLGTGRVAYQARYPANGSQSDLVRFKILSFGNPARFTLKGLLNVKGEDPADIMISFIDKDSGDTLSSSHLDGDGSFTHKVTAGKYDLLFSAGKETVLEKQVDIPANFPQDVIVIRGDISLVADILSTDTIHLKDIRFAFNKSHTADTLTAYISRIIDLLQKYPELKITVNGYADALGNKLYNMRLSHARAMAVAGLFTNSGIAADRVIVHAFGENHPVALNTSSDGKDNPEGRAFNRRVELVLSDIPLHTVVKRDNDIPVILRVKK